MRVETKRMYLYPLSDEEMRLVIEIGYGLKEEYRHHGYMTEAVKAITEWALSQESVKQVEAETDAENIASQKVLFRSGFVSNGKMGEEGPRFVYR